MTTPLVNIDSGQPDMADHQPSTDVTAGDVLVIGPLFHRLKGKIE